MMDKVAVYGIRCYAYHGCIDEEALAGGHFTVDLIAYGDFKAAAQEDSMINAVDYVVLSAIAIEQMKVRSKTIEHAALRIGNAVKSRYPDIATLEVGITKHRAPTELDIDRVQVWITV